MAAELDALSENGTFQLAIPPPDKNVVSCKWVFALKKDAHGEIDRHKARLVARGFSQRPGEDYELTFAPVMGLATLKYLLTMACIWNVDAEHGDIPNAYVRAELKEVIYMDLPPGMELKSSELNGMDSSKVKLLLLKSLYGLKQSGKEWNDLLHSALRKLGFNNCESEACLYVKKGHNGMTLVGIYVDDLIVVSTSQELTDDVFNGLKSLQIKRLGPVERVLGVNIKKVNEGYHLRQDLNIDDLAEQFRMSDARRVDTPIGTSYQSEQEGSPLLTTNKSEFVNVTNYQRMVGSILWIYRCTRPDIGFAVHRLTRKSSAPTLSDWNLGKRTIKYLISTKWKALEIKPHQMKGKQLTISASSDADWATDQHDRKSVSGGVVRVNGAPIEWVSKKQTLVATSTMEAEFVAATTIIQNMLWMKNVIFECGLDVERPMLLHVDNQAAIKVLKRESSACKSKHLDLKLKFIRHHVVNGDVEPNYVATEDQEADALTKALAAPQHRAARDKFNLVDGEIPAEKEC